MEAYQKFKQIFSGLTRAHGVFYKGEKKESGKVGGKAFIIKEDVIDKHWKEHIRALILLLVLSPYVMMLLALGLALMLTITP